jgi:putative holliday junction resolvase
MPICEAQELPRRLVPGARLLGLDVGTKTVGMALSDTTRLIASPLSTLRRTRFREDAGRIAAAVAEHGVGAVVIGLPLQLDGRDGPRTQGVRQFARNLAAYLDCPIVFWDERLSTAAVERGMIAGDLSRARRREIIDRAAAAYILQGFLDWLRRTT